MTCLNNWEIRFLLYNIIIYTITILCKNDISRIFIVLYGDNFLPGISYTARITWRRPSWQNMLYSTLNLWKKYKILLWLMVYFISLYVLPQRAVWNKGDTRHSFTCKNSVEICMLDTLILLFQVNPMWVTLLECLYSYIHILTLLF
jgi:hypothetical protein